VTIEVVNLEVGPDTAMLGLDARCRDPLPVVDTGVELLGGAAHDLGEPPAGQRAPELPPARSLARACISRHDRAGNGGVTR
jgi:hypothetical protein